MKLKLKLFPIVFLFSIIFFVSNSNSISSQPEDLDMPVLKDNSLKIELIVDNIKFPTGMELIGDDQFLVIEKNTGEVKLIDQDKKVQTLLDLNVANKSERGLIGLAFLNNTIDKDQLYGSQIIEYDPNYVFLFVTETENEDNGDILGNRLYRYEFTNMTLVNPVLLLDLPYLPGPSHNGGVIRVGPDGNIYFVMGDLNRNKDPTGDTLAQNLENTFLPDGRGGILRITPDGDTVRDGFQLGNDGLLNKYYAYGIRNSFGIGFDPITGYLWDTENGSHYGDEINIIKPGFNSGWRQVLGLSPLYYNFSGKNFSSDDLITFNGNSYYTDPVLMWNQTIAPTTISFIDSTILGDKYTNDMLVAGVKNGTILHFDLNDTRTGLDLPNDLKDKIVNTPSELDDVIFGTGFALVTDIKIDHTDGDLYILSSNPKNGKIYKISKTD